MDYSIRDIITDEIERVIAQERIRNPHFRSENYRIVLGYRIAEYEITDAICYADCINSSRTFKGIQIGIDSINPYMVELLKRQQVIDFGSFLNNPI